MQIRKLFKFECAHIVRKAYSTRCSQNIHWHSYKVEFFFKGNKLDEAQMVMDFGLIKAKIADFIDSFDHTLVLWNLPEEKELIKFAGKNFERVIVLPFNSSAEMQAKMFYDITKKLVPEIIVEAVRVHETDTWYWEYKPSEYDELPTTSYPIKIFTKNQTAEILKDAKTTKDSLRISEWISEERKDWERVDIYNSTFIS